MNILEVGITNFLAIGSATFKLRNRGLVLLQGENRDDSSQDSNGAGKSSIPDALSWCLYGVTAREESGNEVINIQAGKNCCVAITIDDDGNQYRISRHRKHTKHKNRLLLEQKQDDDWKDLTLGTDKLTQQLVAKLVGCSKDVFCAAIYAGQENLVDLPAMTDKFLKSVVEEAAGIDRLQHGYAIATKRVAKEKGKVKEIMTKIDGIQSRIDLQSKSLVSLEEKRDSWESDRTDKLKSLAVQIRDLKAQVAKGTEEDLSGQFEKINAQIKKVESGLEAANRKNNDIVILEGKIEHLTEMITKENRNVINLENKSERLKEAWIDAKNAKILDCEMCGQKVSSDEAKAAHVASHRKTYDDHRSISEAAKEAITEQREQLRSMQQEHESKAKTKTDTSKFKSAMTKLSTLKSAIIKKQSESENLKTRMVERARQLKSLKESENPHVATISETTSQIEIDKTELASTETELEKAEYQLQVAEASAKVFGPAGVRAHLLDTVTPFLNDRTSHYLSTLSDGNISAIWTTLAKDSKGELKEKFSISVESVTGGKSFKSLSGGEKRKVRLATYLALQDLVASRASKPINLLIADEIDQAIDKSGLERLMSILDEKAKERGTAIVISHTDLKSWISDSVTIVKEGGMSRIEGHALS